VSELEGAVSLAPGFRQVIQSNGKRETVETVFDLSFCCADHLAEARC